MRKECFVSSLSAPKNHLLSLVSCWGTLSLFLFTLNFFRGHPDFLCSSPNGIPLGFVPFLYELSGLNGSMDAEVKFTLKPASG